MIKAIVITLVVATLVLAVCHLCLDQVDTKDLAVAALLIGVATFFIVYIIELIARKRKKDAENQEP